MLKTKKQMLEEIAHLNASLKGSHSLWEDLAKECDALKAENAKLNTELVRTREARDDAIKDVIHLYKENEELTDATRQNCCAFLRQKERADALEKELAAHKASEITVGAIRQSAEEYRDEFIIPTKEKGWEILR